MAKGNLKSTATLYLTSLEGGKRVYVLGLLLILQKGSNAYMAEGDGSSAACC